jgi:hypothetical protein
MLLRGNNREVNLLLTQITIAIAKIDSGPLCLTAEFMFLNSTQDHLSGHSHYGYNSGAPITRKENVIFFAIAHLIRTADLQDKKTHLYYFN